MTHHCISNHIILESNSRLAENVGQQSAPLTVKNRGWELATSRLTLVCRYLCLLTKFWPILYFVGEEAMATHSSTLARQIPWMEEPGRLQSMGSLEVRDDRATSLSFSLSCIGEVNGNPLQCSCLENPRDGGDCWAAVYGVAQSRTRLKRLSSSSRGIQRGERERSRVEKNMFVPYQV